LEELTQSTGLTEKKAATLIAAAREMAQQGGPEALVEPAGKPAEIQEG
jgi:endonuclease III